jgi:pullulanase
MGVANSYNKPDSINEIDWSRKTRYKAVFEYYRGLVALRKNHPAFRMTSTQMINQNLKFTDPGMPGVIVYLVANNANGDKWKNILVILNGNTSSRIISLPAGKWTLAADRNYIKPEGIKTSLSGTIAVDGTAAYVLYSN